MGNGKQDRGTRARSVIPGRQRWDVAVVLNRADAAELLESELKKLAGIEMARASPLTGRLLVVHDKALACDGIGQQVRSAVGIVEARIAVVRASRATAKSGRVAHRVTPLDGAIVVVVVAGLVFGSPLVRLGAVLLATAGVIRRAWSPSSRRQQGSTELRRPVRHPILTIVGSHKGQFHMASALSFLGELLEMAPAIFIGWMFMVAASGPSALLVRLGVVSAVSQLGVLAAMTGLVLLAGAIVSLFSEIVWRDLAQEVQEGWRNKIFADVQATEMRYIEGERASRLARVLTDDVEQLGRFLAYSANELVQIGTTIVLLIPVFLFLAPGIGWIALLPVPFITWLSFHYQEGAAPSYSAGRESASQLNSQLINNLEAAVTVRSYAAQEFEIQRIRRLGVVHRKSNREVDIRTALYRQAILTCTGASLVGILLFGGIGVFVGVLAIPVYQVLILLPRVFFARLPRVGDAIEQYERSVASLGRLLEVGSLPVETDGAGQPLDVAMVKGELVLERVTFAYPNRAPVLQDLTLRIATKKTTAIVGATGAGKTTIAKLLLRLEDVESGRVLLDGIDIRDIRLSDLRAAIGFVPQDAFMFDGTIADNIRYGTFGAEEDIVAGAARLAEADGFIEALRERYATMVGERGVTLSGGQRQRLSLARAIVKSAPILILDEATSAVDNETEAAIKHAIEDFARNRTLVIIAHRLSTIRNADWIYVLGNGRIVEQGRHAQLVELGGVYASLWDLQVGEAGG